MSTASAAAGTVLMTDPVPISGDASAVNLTMRSSARPTSGLWRSAHTRPHSTRLSSFARRWKVVDFARLMRSYKDVRRALDVA